jgi:hypothetical protein
MIVYSASVAPLLLFDPVDNGRAQMFTAAAVKKHHPHRAIYGRIGVGAIGVGLAGQTVGWKTDGILISVEMDGRGVESVIIVTADGFDFSGLRSALGAARGRNDEGSTRAGACWPLFFRWF